MNASQQLASSQRFIRSDPISPFEKDIIRCFNRWLIRNFELFRSSGNAQHFHGIWGFALFSGHGVVALAADSPLRDKKRSPLVRPVDLVRSKSGANGQLDLSGSSEIVGTAGLVTRRAIKLRVTASLPVA